jgi:hypothetical protein
LGFTAQPQPLHTLDELGSDPALLSDMQPWRRNLERSKKLVPRGVFMKLWSLEEGVVMEWKGDWVVNGKKLGRA